MKLRIAGMGWVTPLGSGVDSVWQRLLLGEEALPEKIADKLADRAYQVFRVPASALTNLPMLPRLRRASAISRFAAAAGLEALANAGLKVNAENASRIALVFAVSNGSVIYTKRFYHDIVESGAQSASPLLFPETVFNAPASHLAAILGITGATYTLVGDGAVGLLAVRMAEDLMASNAVEFCLVVGAEEADWLLCDAYRKWRLMRLQPPIELFDQLARGTILSEGAGAILLARDGPITIEKTHTGSFYRKHSEAQEALNRVVIDLVEGETDLAIVSANGTFIDKAELNVIAQLLPNTAVYAAKPALGESVGASGLWQIICGANALLTAELPPLLHVNSAVPLRLAAMRMSIEKASRALVIACGMNQQIGALRLSIGG